MPPASVETWLAVVYRWAAARKGCVRLGDIEPYESCRVAGVIRRLRVDPGNGEVEATIIDGTGSLVASWAVREGASQLGATPGLGLILRGVARVGRKGELTMPEPEFELLPGPPNP